MKLSGNFFFPLILRRHAKIEQTRFYFSIDFFFFFEIIRIGILCESSAHMKCQASFSRKTKTKLQSNLDCSNTDGSFTMANSNSFLSAYEILPIAQENKYLRKFSYFIPKLYVVCTH